MKRIHNRILGYILAGAAVFSLAGCSGAASFSGYDNAAMSSSATAARPVEAPQAAAEEFEFFSFDESAVSADAMEMGEAKLSTSSSANASQPRKIVRNAELSLETMEYEPSLERIPALAEQAGGYVESSSSDGISLYERNNSYPSRRSASFTVRVPAENLDSFMASLAGEFNLLNKSESSADISDRYYDTQAHLSNLQIQEKRLLELLEKAGKLADLLEIEKELADVRYQIETLTAAMKRMDSQVSYSSVNIFLQEVVEYQEITAPPRTFGDRLGETFKDSWHNFLNICENLLFGAIYLAPLLLMLAAVLAVVLLIIRMAVRRRKAIKSQSRTDESRLEGWKPESEAQDGETHKKD